MIFFVEGDGDGLLALARAGSGDTSFSSGYRASREATDLLADDNPF
jgi:hypothetical protein